MLRPVTKMRKIPRISIFLLQESLTVSLFGKVPGGRDSGERVGGSRESRVLKQVHNQKRKSHPSHIVLHIKKNVSEKNSARDRKFSGQSN